MLKAIQPTLANSPRYPVKKRRDLTMTSGVAEAPADPAVQGGALRGGRHIDESDAPLMEICAFFLFVVKIE